MTVEREPEQGFVVIRSWDSLPPEPERPQASPPGQAPDGGSGSLSVTTAYREDPGLGVPVPVEMDEVVSWPAPQGVVESIQGKARYSGFRRLVAEATTRERATRP